MINVTATFLAKQGQEKALETLLTGIIEPTRNEEGCLRYCLFQDEKQPQKFMFQEQFKDQAAYDSHSQQSHVKTLLANLDGLLEIEPDIRFYQEL